jgi:alkylated DNA repair dioxygenase AlkB
VLPEDFSPTTMQIEIFEKTSTHYDVNLLPRDGLACYYQGIFEGAASDQLFQVLLNSLNWQPDELFMFGKKVITQRKVAWVADSDNSYTYSGVKKQPQIWTPEILAIKKRVEALTNCKFNSCLLNLYHHGGEGMGWHSDDELELDKGSPIASISFGAIRKFAFRHKLDKASASLFLDNGSVLVMHPPTQEFWKHSLLKTKIPVGPRINLTFRVLNSKHEPQQ